MTCQPCPPICTANVFDRVHVSYLLRGYSRVFWELMPTFIDPPPLTFTLQVGTTANPDADDWTDVGVPVVNQYFAYDPEQRVWGQTNWTHYRIKLEAVSGTYYSPPVGGMGVLDRRSWRLAREEVRKRQQAFRYGVEGQEGYLLKRRVTGVDCSRCLDHMTRESRNPQCPECYGTTKRCGYYYPMSCVWAKMSPRTHHLTLDGQYAGTSDQIVVRAEMLMTELLSEEDVWVAKKTDDRYYVHSINHTAEFRGVPILANVELRPVPFSSIIYSIEIPGQLALPPMEA